MNRSKISRSILVVLFVAMIIFLGYLDIKTMLNGISEVAVHTRLIKVGYAIALIILVITYVILKDKMYRMKIKRNVSLIYRYIYLSMIIIIASVLGFNKGVENITTVSLVIYLVFRLAISFIIKKIIFNVSKSDMLSALGTIAYAMIPNVIQNGVVNLTALLIQLSVLGGVLVTQFLIDELKQRGIKTKKYIVEALTLGLLLGLTTILGVNIIVWFILAVVLMFITVNLDNTHINFPKNIMSSVTQEKRESLYKIERININKLWVSIVLTLTIMCLVFFIGKFSIGKIATTSNNSFVQTISENIQHNEISNLQFDKTQVLNNTANFVSYSKSLHLMLIIYILLAELLAFILRRKYDTKSTMIKTIFMALIILTSMINNNIIVFQPLFTVLLILIAIVNTSNIYLNREERVKMLVA